MTLHTVLPDGCSIEYIDHYGSDLRVANTARVSMDKWKEIFDLDDVGLINYLAKNKHDSPMRHCVATFRFAMPIFVERQWFKHRLGIEVNSLSGRYVQFDEQLYLPTEYRKGSKSIKQGSLDKLVNDNLLAYLLVTESYRVAYETYKSLLAIGVCKEQARMVLPLSLMTRFVATIGIQAAFHIYELRFHEHAQREIQPFAYQLGQHFSRLYPVTWKALLEHRLNVK